MRIAYLDCASGISGDMLLSSLIDAGADVKRIASQIASLKFADAAGVKLEFSQTRKNGFRSGQISISHPPQRAHRHLSEIQTIIATSELSPAAKSTAVKIFEAIGQAEATVHGMPLEKVHFHEVGAIDSIVDILGVAIAIDQMKIDRFISSPVPTGCGKITIAHGEVSVPAPATAWLLKQVPIEPSDVAAELTTPTGAAFLNVLVDAYGSLPAMTIECIGVGCGTMDFDSHANILRVMIGSQRSCAASEEVADDLGDAGLRFPNAQYQSDAVVELSCNLDDASGEIIGNCTQRLLDVGALDVWTTSIAMKKNRPGTLLSVLAKPALIPQLEEILFLEARTLGVRRQSFSRTKLPRREQAVSTEFGDVKVKMILLPDGQWTASPEFESCRTVSQSYGVPLRQVYDVVIKQAMRDNGLT